MDPDGYAGRPICDAKYNRLKEKEASGKKLTKKEKAQIEYYEKVQRNRENAGSTHGQKSRLPRTNGHWQGKPGDGIWYSDNPLVNAVTGGKGIPFKNGRPDFSAWSQDSFTFKKGELNGTDADFNTIYSAVKEKYKLPSNDAARQMLSDLGWTPHHLSDIEIIMVPTDLHGNIPHIGSASDMRNK